MNKKKPCEAYIVFDGTSYFGIYAYDLELFIEEEPEGEIIEKHSYWSDDMDKRIECLNNGI